MKSTTSSMQRGASASREGPPAALDDAIRAAARRAVGAGPSRARHMRSWPLAAAAVVTVLAIGIVQLTPPEQVTPTIVADSASRLDALKEQQTTPLAAPATGAAATQAAPPQVAATPPPIDRANSVPRKQIAQPAAPLVPADRVQPSAPRAAGGVASGEMTASRDRDAVQSKSKSENAAPEASAKKERAEPFPAGSTEAKVAANVPDGFPIAANRAGCREQARCCTRGRNLGRCNTGRSERSRRTCSGVAGEGDPGVRAREGFRPTDARRMDQADPPIAERRTEG